MGRKGLVLVLVLVALGFAFVYLGPEQTFTIAARALIASLVYRFIRQLF